ESGRVGRPREVEALAQLAAEAAQSLELPLLLDPFGNDSQVQRPPEGNDRGWECPFGGVIVNELAGDLEDVDGESAQVAERGVAGAEVIDGDANAPRAEVL